MQSYMNSLNESAVMEMDSSPVRETPPNPEDCSSKEAIGAISRAYRNIFTGSSDGERPAKMANISTINNNTSSFSQDTTFSQPNSTQSYPSCPVATAALCPVSSSDNKQAFRNVDSNGYAFSGSTINNYEQPHSTTNPRGSSGNYNSFHSAENTLNQPSCPWKLAPGSKVLVKKTQRRNHMRSLVRLSVILMIFLWLFKGVPAQCLACVRTRAFQSGDMGIFLSVLHSCSEGGCRVCQGDPRIPGAQPTRPGHAAQIRHFPGESKHLNPMRSLFTLLLCFCALNFMAFNSITGSNGQVLHFVQC